MASHVSRARTRNSDQQRRHEVSQAFARRFGREATHWVRAPGRVDAMGSHTDYNEGFVLTLTIDRDRWIAASPRSAAVFEWSRSTWAAAASSQ